MPIKNVNYRKFLDTGIILFLEEDDIKEAMNNIKGRYSKEGRALLIALYYTGARPNEILRLKSKDLTREGTYIKIMIQGSKGGLPRTLFFQYKLPMVKELYMYSRSLFLDQYLFFHYMNKYKRKVVRNGKAYERIEITGKLGYYLDKWFEGIVQGGVSPYYLRHNRFSKLAEAGLTDRELRMIKGSRSTESVNYYIHMSKDIAKKAAKKVK